jgi:uncharacterized protein YjiS (DUF1127 family)
METMMRTLSNTIARRGSSDAGILAVLAGGIRCWWDSYNSWRLQEAAIARLKSMSDHELKDIGISRSQIDFAVMGDVRRSPTSSRSVTTA